MKVMRLSEGESLVIGDPASESCIIIRAKRKTELVIAAESSVLILRLRKALERLKEDGQQPSNRIREYLAEIGKH